ncbi:hypothetical protein DBR11_12640 [Pedobacter sp. HMWF019]|nr:hypothetical protein DBR11_12640 [Pedobacter sp. HMWF019]
MSSFTIEELLEAKNSIDSTRSKCEKAILKLKENSSQHTLMVRRIKALRIALQLIERELQ